MKINAIQIYNTKKATFKQNAAPYPKNIQYKKANDSSNSSFINTAINILLGLFGALLLVESISKLKKRPTIL